MKVFVDTNVILDVLAHREPFFNDSQAVVSLCASGEIEGVVSDVTICNVAYVLRKRLDRVQMRSVLKSIRTVLNVASVDETVVDRAIETFASDFEDSVQMHAAMSCGANCIVTRNVKHFSSADLPVYTPTEYLNSK